MACINWEPSPTAGIFNAFGRLDNPIVHLNGVPLMTKPIQLFSLELPQLGNNSHRKDGQLALGLSWAHRRTCQRREWFPSWSWTGWKGEAAWETIYDPEMHRLGTQRLLDIDIKFAVVMPGHRRINVEDIDPVQARPLLTSCCTLEVTGSFATAEFLFYRPEGGLRNLFYRADPKGRHEWTQITRPFLSTGTFNCNDTTSDPAADVLKFECLLITSKEMLILRTREEGTFERIGFANLDSLNSTTDSHDQNLRRVFYLDDDEAKNLPNVCAIEDLPRTRKTVLLL